MAEQLTKLQLRLKRQEAEEKINKAFDLRDQAIALLEEVLEEAPVSPGKTAYLCLIEGHSARELAEKIWQNVSPTRVILVDKLPETPEERAQILENARKLDEKVLGTCKCDQPSDISIDGLTCGKCGGWIL